MTNNSTRPNMSYYKLYRKLLVSLLRHAKKWPASRLADRHASLVALPFILTCDMLPASVWRIAAISVSTMGDGSAYPGLPGTGGLNWGRLPGRHEKRGFATISAIWCEATKNVTECTGSLATGSRSWDTAATGRACGSTRAGTSAPDMSAWRGDAATHLSKSAMPLYLAQREQTPCLNGPCGRAWATAACGELGGRHDLDLSLSRPRRPSPTRPCIKPSPAFTRHGVTTEQGG